MTLHINGENREFDDGILLSNLFEEMGMKTDRVAVERNGEIVPRRRWAETALADGDRLEIVHFVGGGLA
jgi:thiamine biosynthesis protein ThiS